MRKKMAVTLLSFIVVFSGCTIFTLVLCLILHLDYLHKKYSHIPGPRRESFFWGNAKAIERKKNEGKLGIEIIRDYCDLYGPVTLLWFANKPVVVISDAELVKKALITCDLPKDPTSCESIGFVFGQRFARKGLLTETNHTAWVKKRHAMNPALHRNYLKELMKEFNFVCDRFLETLSKVADGCTPVRMGDEFNRIALDMIGKVAFGIDLNATSDPDLPFPSAIREALQGITWATNHPFHTLDIASSDYQSSIVEAVKFLRDFGKKVIDERKEALVRGDDVPSDVLSFLLKSSEEDPNVTLDDVLDEFLTFFVAGHETTAGMLSFLLTEIGQHPEIMERLVREVDDVLGSRKFVQFNDLARMQYTSQVVKETLRLHPPVPGFSRTTAKEETFGAYKIPATTNIQISTYIMHRHPGFWSDPEKFDPERFSPENEGSVDSYAYFPFSLGSRGCIGQTFALFESKVLISRFLKTFRLELAPNQDFVAEEKMTHSPKDAVLCTLSLR